MRESISKAYARASESLIMLQYALSTSGHEPLAKEIQTIAFALKKRVSALDAITNAEKERSKE